MSLQTSSILVDMYHGIFWRVFVRICWYKGCIYNHGIADNSNLNSNKTMLQIYLWLFLFGAYRVTGKLVALSRRRFWDHTPVGVLSTKDLLNRIMSGELLSSHENRKNSFIGIYRLKLIPCRNRSLVARGFKSLYPYKYRGVEQW